MADNRNFFAKAFGIGQQQAQPQYPGTFQPMFPGALPPQPQQQAPQGQQAVEQARYDQQVGQELTGEQLAALKRAGAISFSDGVKAAMGSWGGNKKNGAARFEQTTCPECGGSNFFTRHNLRDRRSGSAPAPMCMECGYNGLYESLIAPDVDPSLPEAN